MDYHVYWCTPFGTFTFSIERNRLYTSYHSKNDRPVFFVSDVRWLPALYGPGIHGFSTNSTINRVSYGAVRHAPSAIVASSVLAGVFVSDGAGAIDVGRRRFVLVRRRNHQTNTRRLDRHRTADQRPVQETAGGRH